MSSPSRKAFLEWWSGRSQMDRPAEAAEAAWQAGIEYAIRLGTQAERQGSDLRGRVVTLFRPLDPRELRREDPGIDVEKILWPALVLDDGTLVYAAKTVGRDDDGKAIWGPAQLVGQRVSKTKGMSGKVGDYEKVAFNLSVHDFKVEGGEPGDQS